MTELIATKAMRYAGRSLEPGDAFSASSPRDARILTAIRKAEPAPPPDPLDVLRAEAEAAGVDVDRRWGEDRLRQEIATATAPKKAGAYQRRDMRARG